MSSKASKKRKEQAPVLIIPPAREASISTSGSDDIESEKEGDTNDDIEEVEEEETRLSFTSTWRAITSKETLFGSQSNVYIEGDIKMLDLLAWKAEVLSAMSHTITGLGRGPWGPGTSQMMDIWISQ
jgi:hypothetical protein